MTREVREAWGAGLRRVLALAAGVAVALVSLAGGARAQGMNPKWVHDPVIIRQGDWHYLFSTGDGIPIRRSADLVRWERVGQVFPGALPEWAAAEVPGTEYPWAPDVSFLNGRYHLYYSISTGGGQRSVIGLATNATLDPASPEYRWVDHGKVVESFPGVSTYNAIDPNVVLDEHGDPWLSWGSFWGGLKMRRLDRATGMLSRQDTTLHSLAARAGVDATRGPIHSQSVEAPFIVRRGEFYYLFASYDMCCRGVNSTYNIRVGRSRTVTGPYLDEHDVPMTEGGGLVLLSGAGRVLGPGHNAILIQGDRYLLVHHFYDAANEGTPTLQIRPLSWKKDGWPVAGDPLDGAR